MGQGKQKHLKTINNMNSTPIVSVIIPCYKQSEFLPDAINSLLRQKYTNWEAIIINDGSPDNTDEVAKQLLAKDNRIHYIIQDNQGVSAARNNGINHSTGKYILPLDADDQIESTYIAKAVDFLEKHPDYAVFTCKTRFVGDKDGIWDVSWTDYKTELIYNGVMNSSVYRRKDWERVGGYNTTLRNGHDDWEFIIRLLYNNDKVFQTQEILFFYRVITKRDNLTKLMSRNCSNVESELYKLHIDKYIEYYGNPLVVLREHSSLKNWANHRLPKMLKRLMIWRQRMHDKLKRL